MSENCIINFLIREGKGKGKSKGKAEGEGKGEGKGKHRGYTSRLQMYNKKSTSPKCVFI
jgi:predicted transposase YdaD